MTPTYNQQYSIVNVYAGKDPARIEAWRAAATAEGLTIGRWLAKIADQASGYKKRAGEAQAREEAE